MHGRHIRSPHRPRALLPVALLCSLITWGAQAATITVDTADNTPGGAGCSLREALTSAQFDDSNWGNGSCASGSGADTIVFDTAVFPAGSLTSIVLLPDDPIYLSFASTDITIDGDGRVELAAGHASRVVYAEGSGVHLTLQGLTLSGGQASGDGGSLYLDQGVTFRLENSVVKNSTATINGGAIFSRDSTLTVVDSVFTGNQAGGEGGAIYSAGSGSLSIEGSRFEGNTAQTIGGALRSGVPTTITGSVITGNILRTPGSGAGVSFTLNHTRALNDNQITNNAPGNNCGGESFEGSGNRYWPPSDTSCPAKTGIFSDPTPAPPSAPTPVPTLGQWAVLLLSTVLAGFAMTQVRRARAD